MSEAVAHGPKARLELARDILNIRGTLGANPSIALKHLAANRIGAIRRVLLGRPGAGLLDQLLTPSMGLTMLQSMANEIREAGDYGNPEAVAKLNYIGAIQSGLSALAGAERGAGAKLAESPSLISDITPSAEVANAMIDASIERGKIPDQLREQLPELAEMAKRALSVNHDDLLKEHAPEAYAKREAEDAARRAHLTKLEAAENELRAANKAIGNAISTGQAGEGQDTDALVQRREAAKAAYEATYKAYCEHWDGPLKQAMDSAREAVKAAQAKLQAPLIEAAKAYTDSIVQASPVTAEQATVWADAQEVTPQARARLKKIGYDVQQLRKDMAEFYRFTGGRVVKIKVHSKGDRRANATGIEAHGKEGTINLDSNFDKRILWHELAHHIEADPVAKMQAGRFIRRRSEDGKSYSLNSLTGGKGYRPNEAAYKDHFFHPYVGKIYRDGITEVFSMGVESFSDPLTLGQRLLQDPQTLEFVAGYLKQPIHPLAKAHMALRERLIDMTGEANAELENEVEQLQAQIARGVEFTTDTDASWLKEVGWDWWVKGKQIGFFPGSLWYVFEDKVRNPKTGRKVAGLLMIKPNHSQSHDGSVRWSMQSRELDSRDMTLARVAEAGWQKTGFMPQAYHLNNMDYLRKILEA